MPLSVCVCVYIYISIYLCIYRGAKVRLCVRAIHAVSIMCAHKLCAYIRTHACCHAYRQTVLYFRQSFLHPCIIHCFIHSVRAETHCLSQYVCLSFVPYFLPSFLPPCLPSLLTRPFSSARYEHYDALRLNGLSSFKHATCRPGGLQRLVLMCYKPLGAELLLFFLG